MSYKVVTQNNYLEHHGREGQEWGKRNGPPYPLAPTALSSAEKNASKGSSSSGSKKAKKSNDDDVEDFDIEGFLKPGKDGKASSAERVGKAANEINSNIHAIKNRSKVKQIEKHNQEEKEKINDYVKSLSDEELRKKINRLELEKRYISLSKNEIKSGKDQVDDVLDTIGNVLTIGTSAALIASQINRFVPK